MSRFRGPIRLEPTDGLTPRGIAQMVARSRREFLRTAIGACPAAPLSGLGPAPKPAPPRGRKAVVVTFGRGARDDETFTPEGQENILYCTIL